jgi:2-iminobutanoate/2-iminopropanoate deaminase
MDRKVISDAHAPNPIGPYNQAVISNGFVFTAGQIAIDPDTGQLVEGDLTSRVEQVFRNLSAILERAGSDLSKVVKFTVFLTDMGSFAEVNKVFNQYLDEDNAPARSTVEVSELPIGTDVEIECIAAL